MNRKLLFVSSLFTFVVLVFIYACQKESGPTVVDNTPFNDNSVEKNAVIATTTFEAISDFAQAGFISTNFKAGNISIGSCPTINVNYLTPPYSISLDWGTECSVGKGKIDISLSGLMTTKENVATFKIENYIVDNKKVTGTTKITYSGPNPGNNWPRYDFISEGKIVYADNSFITFRYDGVRLLAEGANTATVLDDLWRTEIHSSNGVNKDGTTWTAKSTKVMIKKGDCQWYNSGIYEITPSKGDKITIDFGFPTEGSCDNKAKMTVGSKVTEITLN
ncbi:MAG: hypothetical protein WCP08_01605 [Prolixibacteraceae bacterium]